jgi:GTP cyclohydrolase I
MSAAFDNPDNDDISDEEAFNELQKEMESELDPDERPFHETPSTRGDFEGFDVCLRQMISIIGDDPDRDGLKDTPRRVMAAWDEMFSGYKADLELLFTTFHSDGYASPVVLAGIEFHSTCEHHMLPFYGVAHVGYIPDDKIVGISKLARLVDVFSRRLQNQERIAVQVAEAIDHYLKPKGVFVMLEGSHMCMSCRGVRKQQSAMITSHVIGSYSRSEFLSSIAPYRSK